MIEFDYIDKKEVPEGTEYMVVLNYDIANEEYYVAKLLVYPEAFEHGDIIENSKKNSLALDEGLEFVVK